MAAEIISGKLCRIEIGTDLLELVTGWSITYTTGIISIMPLDPPQTIKTAGGDDWSGTINMPMSTDATSVQDAVLAAKKTGAIISNIKFYVNFPLGWYWAPDTIENPNSGIIITAFNPAIGGRDQALIYTVNFDGTGALDLFK